MTLEQAVNKYDRAVDFYLHELEAKKRSKKTLRNYQHNLHLYREFFARVHENDEEVNDPGYLDFQMWRDELAEKGASTATINRYLSDVRNFFSFVSDEDLGDIRIYDRNPCSARVIPNNNEYRSKPYDQILTDEQVARLWENTPISGKGIKTANWPRNYAITVLLLSTEIRNKELLDLKLKDVDFEYQEIQIWHGKGNKYRCVDCPEIALTAIKLYLQSGLRPAHLTEDDYLFGNCAKKGVFGNSSETGEWNRGSAEWLSALVRRHVKLVTGVENVSTHDLRHVGARLDLHNGMRAEELQAKLGHANMMTTQIYSGKLGTKRRRVTAAEVYKERNRQAERNKEMLAVV